MKEALRLLFVRHGTTKANQEKRFLGWLDLPLSEEGEGEVKALATRLNNEKISHVISCPLLRARQTAAVIAAAHDLPVTIDERLIELNYGIWDGLTWEEFVDTTVIHELKLVCQASVKTALHSSTQRPSLTHKRCRLPLQHILNPYPMVLH